MIYFVRHGESKANPKDLFVGQKEDSMLTEKGREQAKATAQEIKKVVVIDKIISSPLRRTLETAEIIAKELGFDISEITTDNRIAEYEMGSLTGIPRKKITSTILVSSKNAENPEIFRERVYECVEKLSQSLENILLVSHSGVGMMLETIKKNGNTKLFYDIPAYPNTSVNKLDWIK